MYFKKNVYIDEKKIEKKIEKKFCHVIIFFIFFPTKRQKEKRKKERCQKEPCQKKKEKKRKKKGRMWYGPKKHVRFMWIVLALMLVDTTLKTKVAADVEKQKNEGSGRRRGKAGSGYCVRESQEYLRQGYLGPCWINGNLSFPVWDKKSGPSWKQRMLHVGWEVVWDGDTGADDGLVGRHDDPGCMPPLVHAHMAQVEMELNKRGCLDEPWHGIEDPGPVIGLTMFGGYAWSEVFKLVLVLPNNVSVPACLGAHLANVGSGYRGTNTYWLTYRKGIYRGDLLGRIDLECRQPPIRARRIELGLGLGIALPLGLIVMIVAVLNRRRLAGRSADLKRAAQGLVDRLRAAILENKRRASEERRRKREAYLAPFVLGGSSHHRTSVRVKERPERLTVLAARVLLARVRRDPALAKEALRLPPNMVQMLRCLRESELEESIQPKHNVNILSRAKNNDETMPLLVRP